MALPFPLIPVLIGAAIGSLVTYILTARNARNQLTDAFDDIGDAAHDAVKKGADVAENTADAVGDAARKASS
ncbi:MAG: YtxH domain-containing protein [Thiohalocapsa sp.]